MDTVVINSGSAERLLTASTQERAESLSPSTGKLTSWLRRSRSWLILLLFVGGGYLAGAWWSGNWPFAPAKPLPNGGLVIDPKYLDFGEVWEDSKFQWVLPIHNPTKEDVAINSFSASCSCLAIEPKSITVRAGETKDVKLTLNLTAKRSEEADLALREFQVHIMPDSEVIEYGGGCQVDASPCGARMTQRDGWTIKGQVKSGLKVEPSFVDFGQTLVRGQPFLPRKVTVTPLIPLQELVAKSDPNVASIKINRLPGEEGRFALELEPISTVPAGQLKFDVTLRAIPRQGRSPPPATLHVRGIIMDDIQATPSAILFGARQVGDVVRETILLRSVAGEPFAIESVDASSPGTRVVPLSKNSLGKAYLVEQKITQAGKSSGKIKFAVRAKDERRHVSVDSSYHGFNVSNPSAPSTKRTSGGG